MKWKMLALLFAITALALRGAAQAETEPNNNLQQANIRTVGSILTGYTPSGSDTDCFKIRIARAGVLEVTLASAANGSGYWLDIVDSANGVAGWTNTSWPGGGYSIRLLAPPGTYYLVQYPYLGSAGSSVSYSIATKLDTSDRYEVNNTLQSAALLPEFVRLQGKMDGRNWLLPPVGGDIDYFRINTIRPGIVSARVRPNNTGIGFRMQLVPYTGNPVLADSVAASTTASVSIQRAVPLGAYFFGVERDAGNLSSDSFYTLEFSLDTNNAFATAHRLQICDSVVASTRLATDTDYYALGGTGNAVTITASSIPTGVTLRLIAYSSNFQQIISITSAGSSASLNLPTASGSSYFIRAVEENTGGVFAQYRLSTSSPGCGLGAAQVLKEGDVVIHPNPVVGRMLFVELPRVDERAFAELYYPSGKLMMRQRLEKGKNTLELNGSAGVYYLKTVVGNEAIVSKVLVY